MSYCLILVLHGIIGVINFLFKQCILYYKLSVSKRLQEDFRGIWNYSVAAWNECWAGQTFSDANLLHFKGFFPLFTRLLASVSYSRCGSLFAKPCWLEQWTETPGCHAGNKRRALLFQKCELCCPPVVLPLLQSRLHFSRPIAALI